MPTSPRGGLRIDPANRATGLLRAAATVCAQVLIIAAFIAASVLGLAYLYLIVLPLLVATMLASLLFAPARWLTEHKVPRGLAALLVVLTALAVFVGAWMLLVPQVANELRGAELDVSSAAQTARRELVRVLPLTGPELDQLLSRAGEQLRANAGRITSGVLTGAAYVVEFVTGLILLLVLTFFLVKDGDRIAGWIVARSPGEHQESVRRIGARGLGTLRGYLGGVSVVALMDAVGIGIGLWVIGVPLVLPLAMLTFFGGYFPIIGATVAGLVAVMVALITQGVMEGLLTLGVVLAVQQLESNVLEPYILGRAVPLHPVVILSAITAGAVLAGIVGAFLAVPAAAVASAMGNEVRLIREGRSTRERSSKPA